MMAQRLFICRCDSRTTAQTEENVMQAKRDYAEQVQALDEIIEEL